MHFVRGVQSSVVDPDSNFSFGVDPNCDFSSDADLDRDFYLIRMRSRIRLFTMMRMRIRIQIPSFQKKAQTLKKSAQIGSYSIRSGYSLSLWCGSRCGSGSWIYLMRIRIFIWCGFGSGCGSRWPKWCGSIRIRIHNTGAESREQAVGQDGQYVYGQDNLRLSLIVNSGKGGLLTVDAQSTV